MKLNSKGFTMIELVLVVTILGILAVAALPSFIDVSARAATSAKDGVIGAVQQGIALNKASDLVRNGPPGRYPTALDSAINGSRASTTNPFFTNVLEQGMTDGSWSKNGTGAYVYRNGDITQTYTYTSATGTLR